ncbi:hypothetical protein SLS53_009059 [Cytospora paraplurivora]|uniref:Rhodopsin domain-containing protein n=1 Tax=Cytospora paraplurivora TaxID=2898453 RepID=A0AAN9TZD2_9PEZI
MSIDILILAVPLPMVWRLKMPTRQKVGVSGFFLMGAFACLPTMRPLFVNFSVELLFKEYTSKISLFSGSKTGYFGKNSSNGEHAEPRWNQRSARGSASSLREIVNTCEAVPMSTLEDDSDYAERKPGIVVQKTIRQSND